MIQVDIRPVWRFRARGERDFDFVVLSLLDAIEREGKLTRATAEAGISYRHAWNLIERWSDFLGGPLVVMRRGRGSMLTPLGHMLLWAGKRVQARLAPQFESLASELSRSLNESVAQPVPVLTLHASHDFALIALRELAAAQSLPTEVRYLGSFDALASLVRGECDLAGFHLAEGELGQQMAARYAESIPSKGCRLVSFVRRVQGLIVAAGNPRDIRGIEDLGRPEVMLVNRQRGSGTRALLELLLTAHRVDRRRIRGYDNEEFTHAAVAALVAGGQADVGFGLEAAASRFRLGFVPVAAERYYFACHDRTVDTDAFRSLAAVIRGEGFLQRLAGLQGYSASEPGAVHTVDEALAAHR